MALATLGVVVPMVAAFYEFVVKGRKRLGYRVQMDTTATNVVETKYDGLFSQLRVNNHRLEDPTIVLLRIENNGATNIDEGDYAAPQKSDAGITVTFLDRTGVDAVVTEISDDSMRASLKHGGGRGARAGQQLRRLPQPRSGLAAGCGAMRAGLHRRGVAAGGGHSGGAEVQRAGCGDRSQKPGSRTHRRPPGHGGRRRPRHLPVLGDGVRIHLRRTGRGFPGRELPALLTNQVGADIIRSHGDRPCAELANPQLCRPT